MSTVFLQGPLPELFAPAIYLISGGFAEASSEPPVPTEVPDAVKKAVRDLLRFGGFKPSGRGRPASESLAKAVVDGRWPTIHPLVDECNRLSLNSGLPISVLDESLLSFPLSFRLGLPGEEYVFNPAGQVLDIKGLLVMADATGPTASPVKDAQRSKVSPASQTFLVIVWGTAAAAEALAELDGSLRAWCGQQHASCESIAAL